MKLVLHRYTGCVFVYSSSKAVYDRIDVSCSGKTDMMEAVCSTGAPSQPERLSYLASFSDRKE